MTNTLFIRLLHHEDKAAALAGRVAALREGRADGDVYAVNPESFRQVPNTPFCYWVSERIRRLFTELPPFEGNGRTVKQGLATADDFRFVRAWWEVPAERIPDSMQYAVGGRRNAKEEEKWTEERIRGFQAWCRKRTYEGKRCPFAKGGEYSPYYADIHLVVNWENEGAEIKNNLNEKGGVRSNVWMLRDTAVNYFFRPGLTWPLRAHRFAPQVMPKGSIFSVRGYSAFPEFGKESETLAIFNSEAFDFVFKTALGRFGFPEFIVGILQVLPWNARYPEGSFKVRSLSDLIILIRRSYDTLNEVSHTVTLPLVLQTSGDSIAERAAAWYAGVSEAEAEIAHIQGEIDEIAFGLYGFTAEERQSVGCNEYAVGGENTGAADEDAAYAHQVAEIAGPTNTSASAYRLQHTAYLLSWCVGVAFGRWDVRFALPTAYRLPPTALPDPFDPLPVCPPGMLIGPDGLPAEANRIVSEEWLRKRAEGGMQYSDGKWTISDGDDSLPTARCILPTDTDYPVRVQWDGVLVDDPGFYGDRPHRDDIVRRVREVFDLLWKDKAHEIEQEACDILGVSKLRDYFRKPAGFFQDHLKRYSKSRRKAPIYWPLSTASGSYTLWLYYHRLTDQTLYLVVNKYVEPKISEVERGIAGIENDMKAASGRDATRLTDRLNEARAFLGELRDLHEELLRIAALPYKPDLNDGVIINAAPLHKLFRLRSWAKDTADCWKKLEKGDYDWAHSAYTIWPDRVREVCRTDPSIAIAHGLEDLCEVEAPGAKKQGGRGRRKRARS